MSNNDELKKQIEKLNEPNIENAIRSVKLARMMFLTKDNRYYGPVAEEYIKKMSKYATYCKEDKQEDWTNDIRSVVYKAGTVDDDAVSFRLSFFEYTAKIMEQHANGKSWMEIGDYIFHHNSSMGTLCILSDMMLEYSKDSVEFIDNIIGEGLLKHWDDKYQKYIDEKNKIDKHENIKK